MARDVAIYTLNLCPDFLTPAAFLERCPGNGYEQTGGKDRLVAEKQAPYHGRYDLLWKTIIENVFEDFLRFFFPEAAEIVDFDRGVTYLEQEFQQTFRPDGEQFDPRRVDKLIKVYTRQGKEQCILIHVEAQGYHETGFAKRMFRSFLRIWDKYELPFAVLVIFTEDSKSFKPDRFELDLMDTHIGYRYKVYKILEQDEQKLQQSDNPFAMVILAAKAVLTGKKLTSEKLYELKVDIMKRLLKKKFPRKKIRFVLDFLQSYIYLPDENLDKKFNEEVKKALTQKERKAMTMQEALIEIARQEGMEKGIEKGVEKGRTEEREKFARYLITDLGLNDTQIAKTANVTVEFAKNLRKTLHADQYPPQRDQPTKARATARAKPKAKTKQDT